LQEGRELKEGRLWKEERQVIEGMKEGRLLKEGSLWKVERKDNCRAEGRNEDC
jgi:hypothetical protein